MRALQGRDILMALYLDIKIQEEANKKKEPRVAFMQLGAFDYNAQ
jgi:hypothetical protein